MSCSPTLTVKGTGEAVRKGSFWGLGPCNCIDSFKNKTVRLGTNNYLTIWMGFTLKRLQDFYKVMAGPTVPLTGLCLGGYVDPWLRIDKWLVRHQDWIRYTAGLGPLSKFFLCATFISSEEIILYFVIFVLFQTSYGRERDSKSKIYDWKSERAGWYDGQNKGRSIVCAEHRVKGKQGHIGARFKMICHGVHWKENGVGK